MQREPAIIIGSIEALVISVIGLGGVLLAWDSELTASAVAAASAVVAFLGALLTRSRVYSPATYKADVEAALYTTPPAK